MIHLRRVSLIAVVLAVALALPLGSAGAASLLLDDPGYTVVNEFEIPTGLTAPLGDILFSADGKTAYVIVSSEDTTSAVWSMPVTRDSDNTVIGFGTPVQVFADETMDTGLTFAPNGETLFYRTAGAITQRRSDGAIEDYTVSNYFADFGGLAFIPSPYSNEGNIVTASYGESALYMHSVTDDGDGTYTVSPGSLYADLSADIQPDSLGDLEFITSGPLANTLLITAFNDLGMSMFSIPIDSATGLPVDGSSPSVHRFAFGVDTAWGIGVDPITTNIWLVHFETDSSTGFIHLTQIAAEAGGNFLQNTDYEVINVLPLPDGLTRPLGDLMFSSDGTVAYIIDQAEGGAASLWSLPVIRDASTKNVTAFGTATLEFSDDYLDTGVTYAPGSSTLFYCNWDSIVQRLPDGTTEDKSVSYSDVTGLAVVPAEFPNAGNIVADGYSAGQLFQHAVSDDGDGTFTIGTGALYADLSSSVGTGSTGDLEFLTSGPLAPSLLIAGWQKPSMSLFTIALDPATGLPLEGTTPTPTVFAQGADHAWGVAIDPVTKNIWLINYLAYEEDGEAHLIQIGLKPIFVDGFESGNTSAWSLTMGGP